jgi:hypothetical protein
VTDPSTGRARAPLGAVWAQRSPLLGHDPGMRTPARKQVGTALAALAVIGSATLLAACGDPNAMVDEAIATRRPAPLTKAACPADGAEMGMGVAPRASQVPNGSVPEDFAPIKVIVCQVTDLENRGGSKIRYLLITSESAVSEELVAALQLPNQKFRDEERGACSLEYTPLPYLLLLDPAGQAVRPAIPTDACAKIRGEVSAAVANLPLREIKRLVIDDVYVGR